MPFGSYEQAIALLEARRITLVTSLDKSVMIGLEFCLSVLRTELLIEQKKFEDAMAPKEDLKP